MKIISIFLTTLLLAACNQYSGNDKMPTEEKWTDRLAAISEKDSLYEGSTYLSVYSHVYSISQHKIHNLTAIISLRNTSKIDKVYIRNADYYHTDGNLIRSYVEKPVYINPMETTEIIIFEKDARGGTGGNFIFDWATSDKKNKPHFEGVMISTIGKQGLSFSTQGVEIEK